MAGFRTFVYNRIFHFDKISDMNVGAEVGPWTESRKRPNGHAGCEPTGVNRGVGFDDYVVTQMSVMQDTAGANQAPRANPSSA